MTDRRREWFHVTWSTYGTWLPGDPRGYQTRRGKRYVPPPRRYAKPGEPCYDPSRYRDLHEQARRSLRQNPVSLTWGQRQFVADDLYGQLVRDRQRGFVLVVAGSHVHLLAEFDPARVRASIGRLKARVSVHLGRQGLKPDARLWCAGCQAAPKRTDDAVRAAAQYIRRHARQGGVVREFHRAADART